MQKQKVLDEQLIQTRYRLYKKMSAGKPGPVCTYIRRSLNTGILVLEGLKGIPFSELSVSLYFITKDSSMEKLARIYEAELELAAINQEKFLRGIHKFYNETAIKIKKENMYREFFAFLSETNRICNDIRMHGKDEDKVNKRVLDCYQSILLQQLEYLRPDKFDFTTRCCGISTTGEILSCRDFMPDVDSATDRIETEFLEGKLNFGSQEEYIRYVSQVFAEYGYKVNSLEQMEHLMECDRVELAQLSTMLPFINEYTYDIVPERVDSANATLLDYIVCDFELDELKEDLKHRARMLPTNGQIFEVEPLENRELKQVFFTKFLLRETFYQNKIYLLYKAETVKGEFSGFYEPMGGEFFTVMQVSNMPSLAVRMQKIILYLYATCVLRDGDQRWYKLEKRIFYHFRGTATGPEFDVPLRLTRFARGGKVRPSYGSNTDLGPRGVKKGNEKYEEETRAIQGYIRKLGPGRSASSEAIARAEALGFSLATDETYVQPHMTTVYILRKA